MKILNSNKVKIIIILIMTGITIMTTHIKSFAKAKDTGTGNTDLNSIVTGAQEFFDIGSREGRATIRRKLNPKDF